MNIDAAGVNNVKPVINIHEARDLHNERRAARLGAARRSTALLGAAFCCSNRSRSEFDALCCAVRRGTAFCVNATVEFHVIDYSGYARLRA